MSRTLAPTTTRVDFLDGPAQGVVWDLLRVPDFLRVCVSEAGLSPLNNLKDDPRDDEEVFVYRKLGRTSAGIVGFGIADEIDPEDARTKKTWRAAVESVITEERNARRARQS